MMSWIIKFKWICILHFCLFFMFPANVFAHKIYVFAWAEHGKIFTEAKFSSNKFVKNGKIIVKNDKGKILLSGTTSDKGDFFFEIPENLISDLLIEVDAGMG
ncbi:MAG: carboxypeptidase regulatory-like domain-containing protein, partial [Desulfobacteraceae bacterium]|nr:carboxypeptidase regulatory-like domain-containing protein [Desulfobacteraceae bacterium]